MSNYRSSEALLKFQMAPKLMFLISSVSKIKEPRYACLSKARASHSQTMWAEDSSFTPHRLPLKIGQTCCHETSDFNHGVILSNTPGENTSNATCRKPSKL